MSNKYERYIYNRVYCVYNHSMIKALNCILHFILRYSRWRCSPKHLVLQFPRRQKSEDPFGLKSEGKRYRERYTLVSTIVHRGEQCQHKQYLGLKQTAPFQVEASNAE